MSGRTTEHFVLCAQPCAHVFANLHGLFEGHEAPAAVLFWPALPIVRRSESESRRGGWAAKRALCGYVAAMMGAPSVRQSRKCRMGKVAQSRTFQFG